MALTYFKRFRMEIDLVGRDLSWPKLPEGYGFVAWTPSLVESHADVKYRCFREEIDANVFPCLAEYAGCYRLMSDISHREGFLPEATWLAYYQDATRDLCGTVQGVCDRFGLGSVQNLGITAPHRGRGVGTCLLFRALRGFREAGLNRVFLEVTADNVGAIQLYRRLGFVTVKTVFKASEVAYSCAYPRTGQAPYFSWCLSLFG